MAYALIHTLTEFPCKKIHEYMKFEKKMSETSKWTRTIFPFVMEELKVRSPHDDWYTEGTISQDILINILHVPYNEINENVDTTYEVYSYYNKNGDFLVEYMDDLDRDEGEDDFECNLIFG